MKQNEKDPLKEILDRHLFRAATEGQDSATVVEAILIDYVKILNSEGMHVPFHMKRYFFEDMKEEIKELIVKRTHATVPVEKSQPTQSSYLPPRKLT